jgi:N-methylhydantoinase A
MGLTVEAAALAILDVAVANMINALKLVTVQRGHDPRDAAFVVSGGAGPALGPRLGREMQARFTVIPPHPGIFSAWGMLAARPRADFRTTWFAPLDENAQIGALVQFEGLKADAIAHFGKGDEAAIGFDLSVDARYRGQEHGVLCPIMPDDTVDSFAERFHGVHKQAYTFRLDGASIEMTGLHLEATLETETIRLVPVDAAGRGAAASRKGIRAVWFREHGWTACAVHERAFLPVAEPMQGPLLIEEATATTLVLPGQLLTMTETGILLIREAD